MPQPTDRPPKVAAETLVLRRPGLPAMIVPPAVAAAMLAYSAMEPRMLWAAVPMTALAVLLVAAEARLRVELRPDGIVKRGLGSTQTVTWDQVARVEVVTDLVMITLRDGGRMLVPARRGRAGALSADELYELVQQRVAGHRTAEPQQPAAPDVETVERRYSRGAIGSLGGIAAVLAAAAAVTAGFGRFDWTAPTAMFAVLIGVIWLHALRARTLITAEGVRDRRVVREIFIPWADIADVGVAMHTGLRQIWIARHGGGPVQLQGVHDWNPAPDGLGLDDVVELIRRRAGLPPVGSATTEPGPAPQDLPAVPLTLRPSRRPLLWTVPGAALCAAACALPAVLSLYLIPVVLPAGYLLVRGVFQVVELVRTRTEVRSEWLVNRLVGTTVRVSWQQIGALEIRPVLLGRVVVVKGLTGKRITTLAAPRSMPLGRDPDLRDTVGRLCAMARARGGRPVQVVESRAWPRRTFHATLAACVVIAILALWRPWLEVWWPGNDEVRTLPRACAAGDLPAARMVPGGRREGEHYRRSAGETSRCEWSDEQTGAELRLEYQRWTRMFTTSGTDEARNSFLWADALSDAKAVAVFGVGDEARRKVTAGTGQVSVTWTIREANTVIELSYRSPRPAAQVTADADRAARIALAALRTG